MIIHGDCIEVMKKFPDNHFSAIVTDPPYGLHFMGKDWDQFKKTKSIHNLHADDCAASIAGVYDDNRNDEFQEFIYQVAIEALRIIKPGGHILMCGASRRFHRQCCGLEDAGWKIRDCISWLYGSGFPKSHNHFGINGYGTALKPAWEPIIMAMKPCDGTFKKNYEKWEQAGINVDGCRIPGKWERSTPHRDDIRGGNFMKDEGKRIEWEPQESHPKGRWPANLILDEEAGKMLDEQAEHKASRFFYCAKASSSERNEGLEGMPEKLCQTGCGGDMPVDDQGNDRDRFKKLARNYHPTVKPLALMEYLIKLVMPPKNGILLDPFAGSGTTILAAQNLGFEAIGIEKEAEYVEIARKRTEKKPIKQLDFFSA